MLFILYVFIFKVLFICASASKINNLDVQSTIPIEKHDNVVLDVKKIEKQATTGKHVEVGGNTRPQLMSSGIPWLSRPHQAPINNMKSSSGFIWGVTPLTTSTSWTTSFSPNMFTKTTEFPYIEVINEPTRPTPNRPFYAGLTGGNYHPQLIPPGTPWPARPQDYVTTARPWEDKTLLNMIPVTKERPFADMFEEIIPHEPTLPPYRPLLGLLAVNFRPQIIPPGTPWPAGPNTDNASVTKYTSLEAINNSSPKTTNRPSYNVSSDDMGIPSAEIIPMRPSEYSHDTASKSKYSQDTASKSTSYNYADMYDESVTGTPWPEQPDNSKVTQSNYHGNIVEEVTVEEPTKPDQSSGYMQ